MAAAAVACTLAIWTAAGRAQVATGFEPPTYAGAPAGTNLAGQDGWITQGAPTRVFTHTGNTLNLPPSPAGGLQFIAGTSGGTAQPARALHASNFPGAGQWTAIWDVAATFVGSPPTTPPLGGFSLEDAALQRFWQTSNLWVDPNAPQAWSAMYNVFNAGGSPIGPVLPGPFWQNLVSRRWYRQSTTWDFASNQVLEVSLTDLTTGATAAVAPSGWFLHGGAVPTRPMPTGISVSSAGAVGNTLAWDNLRVVPALQISGFTPQSGTVGNTIIINGRGFGTDPDALSVEILNGARVLPLTVLAAADNQIQVRIDPLPPQPAPGAIRVIHGSARRGSVAPQLLDIIPEDPQGVWAWQRLGDPHSANSSQAFTPVFQPPPPGTRRFFGNATGGGVEVLISGDRLPNSLIWLQARTSTTVRRIAASLDARSIRLRLPGDAQHSAQRLRDLIISGFAGLGVQVDCDISPAGANTWRIHYVLFSPNGQPVPAEEGALSISIEDPMLISPFAVGPITAFHGATVHAVGGTAQIGNIGPSGNDGATITPMPPSPAGLRVYTSPIGLDMQGESVTLTGWGVVGGQSDHHAGSASLRHTGNAIQVFGDFSTLPAPGVVVEVWNNTALVGSASAPAGAVGQITPGAAGNPRIINLGQRVGSSPGFWLTLDRVVTFVPLQGPPLQGNQLRILAQAAAMPMQAVQALDIAAGLLNETWTVTLGSTVGGDVCYANCDGSGTPPILNVADFGCFLQQFSAGAAYANCDGSTTPPVLNVADFACFLQQFAAGCPEP